MTEYSETFSWDVIIIVNGIILENEVENVPYVLINPWIWNGSG
jgi:hypothetical protein